MISKKVVELLNDQVNKELYSAYLYLDMANFYKNEGLNGFANWYNVQALEERDHAFMFMNYLQQNGEAVILATIDKPDKEFKKFIDPLKEGAKHERYVTSLIHDIYAAASDDKDFRTMQFLDWFVKEQAEEEETADDMVKKFELFGSDSKGLYMIGNELRGRAHSPAAVE